MAKHHGFGNIRHAVGRSRNQRVELRLIQVLDQHDAVVNIGDNHHEADAESHQKRHTERAVNRRDDFPQVMMQRADYLQNRLLAAQKREHLHKPNRFPHKPTT